jgi:hypothetical protein
MSRRPNTTTGFQLSRPYGGNQAARAAPAAWVASLTRAEAQVAVGDVVPVDIVLDEMRAILTEMESSSPPRF